MRINFFARIVPGVGLLALVGVSLARPPENRLASSDAPARTQISTNRAWASRMDKPGLKNLHRVTPNLYRGAQPTARGMRELEAMGIKTVINLRAFNSDRREMRTTNLREERISFKTWHPEDQDVIRFLQLVADTNRAPIFVHCQHGSDRTGTMIAIYRLGFQGWSKEEAIAEMTQGGFGFHKIWQNLIRYLRALEVDALKRRAGIP